VGYSVPPTPKNWQITGGYNIPLHQMMVDCYLWEDIEISNIEEGRALNSWLIGL
jgi:hypothetical protein